MTALAGPSDLTVIKLVLVLDGLPGTVGKAKTEGVEGDILPSQSTTSQAEDKNAAGRDEREQKKAGKEDEANRRRRRKSCGDLWESQAAGRVMRMG